MPSNKSDSEINFNQEKGIIDNVSADIFLEEIGNSC